MKFKGTRGIILRAAAAAREDPAKYRRPLSDFADGLSAYWDPTAPVPCCQTYCSGPGGDDKYYKGQRSGGGSAAASGHGQR